MTEAFRLFRQEVEERLGGLTGEQWRERNAGQHLYATYRQYRSCAWCGRIEPKGRTPSRCPGVVRIGTRV